MEIDNGQAARALGDWFAQTEQTLYFVGGYVRNKLLDLPLSDIDVCAAYPAQKLEELQSDSFTVAERSYGLGTVVIVQCHAGEKHIYEYTSLRKDSYGRGGAHRPDCVVFTDDIREDAARRDFTVNALYAAVGGTVLDPLGVGIADLQSSTLRMCAAHTMEEDALRILRMVRFAAELGFSVEAETFQSAAANVSQLQNISAERIRDEFFKILLADTQYGNNTGVLDGLHMLQELDALPYIVPGIAEGAGFEQTKQYHKYDVLEHSLQACAASGPDLRVRLAALLHDIAKPMAYDADGNLYRHPELGAAAAGGALRALRAENALVADVEQLVSNHMFDLDNRAGKKSVVRLIAKLGKEQFLRLCSVREADFAGSGMGAKADSAEKWRKILQEMEQGGAPIDRKQLAVNGNDLMKELGIPQGKVVGALLQKLHVYALKKPQQNNYKSLIRCAKMLYTVQWKDADGGENGF